MKASTVVFMLQELLKTLTLLLLYKGTFISFHVRSLVWLPVNTH